MLPATTRSGKGAPGKSAPATKATKAAPAAKVVPAKAPAKAAAPATPPVLFKRREDWIDLAWSLINSTEFLYRH